MGERYPRYSKYMPSDIEWVGQIPDTWKVIPLFGGVTTESVKNEDGRESNVLSLSYGNIIRREVEKNFGLLPESFSTYQIVNSGDIVLRLTDLQNDKRSLRVGYARERGIITSAYLKLVAQKRTLNSRFLYRLLHSYDTTKVYYGMGGGLRQSMKFDEMRRLPVLVPPLDEQTQIANFLDHETAKIDTLIEKQKQLIELLKEKRQAVISHAVTKGLNPDAPMKDSGVEWLGEVPAHWGVGRLGYCARISNGATPSREKPLYWEDGSVPWLNSAKINDVIINDAQQFITPLAVRDTSVATVKEKDLLMAITGEGQTRGRVAICMMNATINQHLASISLTSTKIDHKYLFFWLSGQYERIRFESTGAGSTKGAITCGDIENYPLPVPPLIEQKEIVYSIEKKSLKLDSLITLSISQVALLQERRTALISAAVTGKIDVRNWEAPK